MIDAQDKQTITLPFEKKRGRGRPKTGKALTPAEKQRAYRERHKANSGNTVTNISAQTENLLKEIEELKIALGKEVAARKKAELASRKVVTEFSGVWALETRKVRKKKWERSDMGSFSDIKKIADYMKFESGTGRECSYRVVNDEGITYVPTAPK